MTLGAGYRYLMSSVARMDEDGPAAGLTGYYAAEGTPPGRFLGTGLSGLAGGLGIQPGSQVTEEQLWRMLGMLQDPVTGEPLGRPPVGHPSAFVDRLGRRRKAVQAVAGFDLTFSVPKSVSVAWALGNEGTRQRIHTAHRRAVEAVIAYGESQVFATRTGRGGVVSEDVRGVVAVAFDHWDSRAHDPQLHTHVVVLNRAQSVADGKWRTLDSKALFRATVGMSTLYNGILADELTADLGWAWTPEQRRRSAEPKWEVDGVPAALRDEFSQRTSAIEGATKHLVADFQAAHGRPPAGPEILRLRQQATLTTRNPKTLTPMRRLIEDWRTRAQPHLDIDPTSWVAGLAGRNSQPLLTASDIDDGILRDAATLVLDNVADKRATFTRANLLAETLRQLHGVRFATATDRIAVAEKTATHAAELAVMLTPPEVGAVPEALQRADGSSKFRARNSEVYATAELIDAEAHLLQLGRTTDGPTVPSAAAVRAAAWTPHRRQPLSTEQVDALTSVVTSGRRLDVLVGAAGTGKSTTMAAVRAVWEATHGSGSVVGLAPSAAAAEVLADAVGVPAENTAKWLAEHDNAPQRLTAVQGYAARLARAYPSSQTHALQQRAAKAYEAYARWALRPGQLVIIDEASMAATKDLHRIATHAAEVGAKVLLVGDWAQLSPVQAGGAFKLLADDRGPDTPTLHQVKRFAHDWEAEATLRLRRGDPGVAATYLTHDRVQAGTREDLLDLLFDAWRADTSAGRRSLMLSADTQTVTDLNTRARDHRVATGEVAGDGVRLGDGTTVGVGDVVVTRLNHRTLATGRGWVKNGDDWVVTDIRADGALHVTRARGGSPALLPADYVRDHVELGYATTAHRAQGRTVDTAHAYITATTLREPLYVMATRGRETNRLYVDTAHDPEHATNHGEPDHTDPADVLRAAITTTGVDTSATHVWRAEQAAAWAPWRLEAQGAATQEARRSQVQNGTQI
ncbi:TrwC relaxase [Phycicoccus sp. Soil803]|nr:TrwC relaxase [Phycicoccus sp. Soil803]